MDIITDLTSEAVYYITALQDMYNNEPERNIRYAKRLPGMDIRELSDEVLKNQCNISKIDTLIWSGENHLVNKDDVFLQVVEGLFKWLQNYCNPEFIALTNNINAKGKQIVLSPEEWRRKIKEVLYQNTAKQTTVEEVSATGVLQLTKKLIKPRQALVKAINYMPVQIIFAMSDKQPKLKDRRLYQLFLADHIEKLGDNPDLGYELLSEEDRKKYAAFWKAGNTGSYAGDPSQVEKALKFLEDEEMLRKELLKKEIAIPFLTFFNKELDEIKQSRSLRLTELSGKDISKFPLEIPEPSLSKDPEVRADEMMLAGLAFSCGGIRSATFNLGVLQKLAELGVLPRFDYLSTVSGGGYIGSWYASWIKHEASLKKVCDRLNKKKAPTPLAEEARPIRWLRMYSNYLSPNTSIMSADAWTVGITWFRNTVINQVVLLLILLSLLSGINSVFEGWEQLKKFDVHFTPINISIASMLIVGGAAYFAASGMRTYNKKYPPKNIYAIGNSGWLAYWLIGWIIAAAALITFWFYAEECYYPTFWGRITTLWPAAAWGFLGMLFVALTGGYHRKQEHINKRFYVPIVLSSLAAAAGGLVLLCLVWKMIGLTEQGGTNRYYDKLLLILAVPAVIEALCITVVLRMAFMGKYFPDERREWWGRLGAMVHRFMFWWIIIAAAALLLPGYVRNADFGSISNLSIFTSWSAFISFAVKLAYSSKDTDAASGNSAGYKELVVRMAPYVFMVGFLLLGAFMLRLIEENVFPLFCCLSSGWLSIICTVTLALCTFLLSWRVGVNEFSLHDFYRNRLVRGYLGAARKRTERERTANGFTGFDSRDDQLLKTFRHDDECKYHGPYPLINVTLNATTVSELDRQDRKAESFLYSPLYCGFDFDATRSSSASKSGIFKYGYRPTEKYSAENGPMLGTAMAISGAAVSPNMGYHSSSATSFLLTIFNVRLGRWTGNPRKSTWQNSDPFFGLGFLLQDLIGKSDINSNYVYLSDGGHFDNMGVYELVRRHCRYIVLGDAEQDEKTTCEGFANAVRRCRVDFGVEIEIDKNSPLYVNNNGFNGHVQHYCINYPDGNRGKLVYIKTAVTGDESIDVREYNLKNPQFPQQSTGDQFFDEAQFESYRKLGYDSVTQSIL